jgi:YesN/AraC family two-component response regulator
MYNKLISFIEGVVDIMDKITEFDQAKKALADAQEKIRLLMEQSDKKDIKIAELRGKKTDLEEQLEQLKQINNVADKKHNERGAGRKSRLTEEDVQKILELYRIGVSYRKIAKQMGLSDVYIAKLIKKTGSDNNG